MARKYVRYGKGLEFYRERVGRRRQIPTRRLGGAAADPEPENLSGEGNAFCNKTSFQGKTWVEAGEPFFEGEQIGIRYSAPHLGMC